MRRSYQQALTATASQKVPPVPSNQIADNRDMRHGLRVVPKRFSTPRFVAPPTPFEPASNGLGFDLGAYPSSKPAHR